LRTVLDHGDADDVCEGCGGGTAEAGVRCGVAAVRAAADHVPDDGGDRVEGAGGQGAVGGDFVDVDLLGGGGERLRERRMGDAWLNERLILRIEGCLKGRC
jgi:hypothetical protein